MDESADNQKGSDLAELANSLEEAKSRIVYSEEKLRGHKKSPESYLILKNGTVAETDNTEHKEGVVTIRETKL